MSWQHGFSIFFNYRSSILSALTQGDEKSLSPLLSFTLLFWGGGGLNPKFWIRKLTLCILSYILLCFLVCYNELCNSL